MQRLFDDPSAILAGFIIASLVSPLLVWLVNRRMASTNEYASMVKDAMELKDQYQKDYENIRKRLSLQDTELLTLRKRVSQLEMENTQLKQQLAGQGIEVLTIAEEAAIQPAPKAPPRRRGKTAPKQTGGQATE